MTNTIYIHQPEKAVSDDYILTLAAIGRELNIRKQTSARIHLAAGLPLTWVSEQKDAFKKYLLQWDSTDFTFRGVEYHIDFVGADIFPQSFATVADHLREFRGVNMLAGIFRRLREHEYDLELMKLYVVGGGGCLVKNFGEFEGRVIINDDICATAKGYEYLARLRARKGGAV